MAGTRTYVLRRKMVLSFQNFNISFPTKGRKHEALFSVAEVNVRKDFFRVIEILYTELE